MRRHAFLLVALAAGLLVDGCTADDDPEQSTEPDDSTEPSPTGEAVTVDGTASADTPPGLDAAPLTPTPSAATEPSPTPAAAPTPAPSPAPSPVPAGATPATVPTSTPSPTPAPTPAPSPTPTPSPTPPPPHAWPREGGTVRYEVVVLSGSPDGSYNQDWFTNWTWTYRGGDWVGRCEGEHVYGPYEEEQQREPISATFTASNPPHWPPMNTRNPPAVGEEVQTWSLFRCEIQSSEEVYRGMEDGRHHATDVESPMPYDYRTHWDPETGLVLQWDEWGRSMHAWGELKSRT